VNLKNGIFLYIIIDKSIFVRLSISTCLWYSLFNLI